MTAPTFSDSAEETRAHFRKFISIPTRWMDNDMYGHVNNVVYYSYFDTAVNGNLIAATGQDLRELPALGIVAETSCRFLQELSFPEIIDAGLRITRLGKRSVIYEIGLFRAGSDSPAALGHFVHVYVDREQRRPLPIPDLIRNALVELVVPGAD